MTASLFKEYNHFEEKKSINSQEDSSGSSLEAKKNKETLTDPDQIAFRKQIIEIVQLDYVGKFSKEGVARAKKKDEWFLIDKSANEISPCRFQYLGLFSEEGLALAKINDKYSFIDKNGQEIIDKDKKERFNWAESFKEGLALVKINDKYSFIDKNGNKIKGEFEEAKSFSEGLALVKIDGKYSFIDKTGKEIIKESERFDEATNFHQGLAGVKKGRRCYFINKNGSPILPPSLNTIQIPLMYKQNLTLSQLNFNALQVFEGNLAKGEIGANWVLIDLKKMEILVNEMRDYRFFNDIQDIGEGKLKVKIADKWHLFDIATKQIISGGYDLIDDFQEGRARVKTNGEWAFIDKNGKLIPPEFTSKMKWFDEVYPFSEGVAQVKKGIKTFYIDKQGRTVF